MNASHRVRVLDGPQGGADYELVKELVIGRADAGLEIMDPQVSRRHAQLTPAGNRVEVRDLGSTNGTFADGHRVNGPVMLVATTTLQIGQTRLRIIIDREPMRDAMEPVAVSLAKLVTDALPTSASSPTPPRTVTAESPLTSRWASPLTLITAAATLVVLTVLVMYCIVR